MKRPTAYAQAGLGRPGLLRIEVVEWASGKPDGYVRFSRHHERDGEEVDCVGTCSVAALRRLLATTDRRVAAWRKRR